MRHQRRMIFCLLIICLFVSAVSTDIAAVVSAKSNPGIRVRLKIGNQTVSGKTISVKRGKRKNIKVTIHKKKKYKITFRSDRPRIVSVSKTGNLTAKRTGTAKVTVTVKIKKKKYKSWMKIRVVPSPTVTPPTSTPALPSDTPTVPPSDAPTTEPPVTPDMSPTTPAEGEVSDTEGKLNMYDITIRVNGKVFSAKLYQTKTTEVFMQKLPLSITMNELNGNEKYYYFSENFPTESQKVSWIHAGDLKLYGSSCLVLFYESFSTSYSYTSLGYVENPEGLAEALGTGNVSVEIVGSDKYGM